LVLFIKIGCDTPVPAMGAIGPWWTTPTGHGPPLVRGPRPIATTTFAEKPSAFLKIEPIVHFLNENIIFNYFIYEISLAYLRFCH
jgi:hypothetical protein